MKNRTIIQWDKDDLEALGLLKIDILSLGMLTAIRKSIQYINNYYGTSLDISNIPPEDPQIYSMLQKGDSLGVFQVESRAQMAMLPRLKPNNFYDLVIEVAIVRPGPIQGDMVHPYLKRRQGLEDIEYPNKNVQNILERTLGIPIFQEQVIKLAMVAAGFSGGEADQLRRAMASWKSKGRLESFEKKIIEGMQKQGHSREFAERLFKQIQGFGEYGFPESHAASFALLVYISAWLKCHEPAAFYCGLLNSLPMGFYSPSQIIQDAKRHNISILDIDVQKSHWDHYLVPSGTDGSSPAGLRLGLRLVKGLSYKEAIRIERNQPFLDINDLSKRGNLKAQTLRFLSRAGAMKSLLGNRYQSYWEVASVHSNTAIEKNISKTKSKFLLPAPSASEDMIHDYQYLGLTLGPHPMKFLRTANVFKNHHKAIDLHKCRNGEHIATVGIVTGRQRPSTAHGTLFLTLEDETGNINVVIKPKVLNKYRSIALQAKLIRLKGIVEKKNEAIHFVPGYLEDITEVFIAILDNKATPFKSRDFK